MLLSSYLTAGDHGDAHTTIVSTKGQIILPEAIRDRRRWTTGTRLEIEDTADGILLKRLPSCSPTTFEAVAGCLKYDGPAKTNADFDAGITAEVKRGHARGRY